MSPSSMRPGRRWQHPSVVITLLLFAGCVSAQDAGPTAQAPDLTGWRYDEDYRYLLDPSRRSGAWWEDVKITGFGQASWLTHGVELRARYEYFDNNEFGASPVKHDGYAMYRLLPYADLRAGEHVRIFAQLNLTHSDRNSATIGPIENTGAELLQGFVDLGWSTAGEGQLSLRGGRQVLAYGSERLISARFGPNVMRSFDGGMLRWENPGMRVDLFIDRPVRNRMGSWNDRRDHERKLWGVYATWNAPFGADRGGLDLYYLGLSDALADYNQGSGRETRNTLGTRWFGKRDGWSWDIEGFYQYGNFAGMPVRAWSLATDVSYTFSAVRFSPKLELKANVISGDRDPDDRRLQTFNIMFPKGKYFGEVGQVGPSNLINLHPSARFNIAPGWSVSTAAVFYWRQSLGDGVYGQAGNLVRAAGNSDARYIGTQGDLILGWEPNRNLGVELAYSVFKPGAFIRETGPDPTVHFVGFEAMWRY